MADQDSPNHASGTFEIAGKQVHRLGFGAMRLTGQGIWGPPADRDECVAVVRRAVELGVELIDTADSYGPYVSEEIIREALHPYPDNVVIATKAGLVRTGPDQWLPVGRPEYLRQEVEMSLRRLGVDRIELFQLHRIDAKVSVEDQIGELVKLQDEGKIADIGLSEVDVDQLDEVRKLATVVTVQNRFNLGDRKSEDVLDRCTAEGIGFIPWAPVNAGSLTRKGGPVDDIAEKTGATYSQVALAWLLARAQNIVPIPGTSSVKHLEENMGAASVHLTPEQVTELSDAA
ncbi:aldo/keto reductase [Jatrophihabitans endophyticus]|uniref:aldo/keto reductase n=1 Tax=Jatrophihabitans endophyticus TaxID=1206085 RepID=UPI0019F25B8E|nr:aldo/keto reductase [Jatrophihabitans endophyticus]MBE7187076.1 aldo/keto reductase [Jatrophihabitans endophyticus]